MIRTAKAVAALSGLYHCAAWLARRASRSDDETGSAGPVLGLVGGDGVGARQGRQ